MAMTEINTFFQKMQNDTKKMLISGNIGFAEWVTEQVRPVRRVAFRLGIDPVTIYRWRRGDEIPSFENTLKLAQYYRMDPMELIILIGREDYKELYSSFMPDGVSYAKARFMSDSNVDLHIAVDKVMKSKMDAVKQSMSTLIRLSAEQIKN